MKPFAFKLPQNFVLQIFLFSICKRDSFLFYTFFKGENETDLCCGNLFSQIVLEYRPYGVASVCRHDFSVCMFSQDYMIFYKEKDGSLLLSWEDGAEGWNMMAGSTAAIFCGSVFSL